MIVVAIALNDVQGPRPLVRADEAAPEYRPDVKPASDDAQKAIAQFRIPKGLQVELIAAEPLLANPVAICFDEQGRIFVAETFRNGDGHGAEDNRDHMDWLDDDLAAQTVEDRLAYLKKRLKEKVADLTIDHDRIRLLEDRDGDGRMDHSTVFDDSYHDILEGIGAGILARRGDVYYACIPNLWLLRDTKNVGKADFRKSLHRGYGVRFAFRGHDLHGLCFGPDGKLYYSIGDRGFNITTEGRTLAYPDRGAVFRCNPDGSELEIFAYGLRNPQKLAFDEFGNLFTCDNNSDSGDKARWVYIAEGGDSGWRMHYQYLDDRGPWNREKLWDPAWDGQAAYIVPPIAHLADGPSGLAYYPGVGMPDEYRGHFFLVDFRGAAQHSGVRSLAVKPKGASFEMVDAQECFWSILATDVTFGPDCGLYVSDWVESWTGVGKGRIYKLFDPGMTRDPLVLETKKLIGEDLSRRPTGDLIGLLGHADMRVRQAAQFALAERGDNAIWKLRETARKAPTLLSRLHAIWCLGQIGRQHREALFGAEALLADGEEEVRAQAAKVLGDARVNRAAVKLIPLLKDESPRVRSFAAIALGKLESKAAFLPLVVMLRENEDRDPFLRHAGVVGLVGAGDPETLRAAAFDASRAVRMGVLLTWRRLKSADVARFLDDSDPLVVLEAARAIHDEPIESAVPQLAAVVDRHLAMDELSADALWRRVLNAQFRLGAAENADAVVRFALRNDVPQAMQIEALGMLDNWARPSNRDRVLGNWRPLPARSLDLAATALRPALAGVLTAPAAVQRKALQVAARLGIAEVTPVLLESIANRSNPADARAEALRALEQINDNRLEKATELALTDAEPLVRAEGLLVESRHKPAEAVKRIEAVLDSAPLVERQAAFAALGPMSEAKADAILSAWLDRLLAGQAPPDVQLDLLTAAAQHKSPEVQRKLAAYEAARSADDPLAAYREAMAGGDAGRGRKIFLDRAEVSCVRCHKLAGVGGEVGPELTRIGAEKDREYLLQSIVDPNKAIAKGFESVLLEMDDGKIISGVLKSEDDRELRLVTADGNAILVLKEHIDERKTGRSPMPEDLVQKLTKSELRDLVEFLSSLK